MRALVQAVVEPPGYEWICVPFTAHTSIHQEVGDNRCATSSQQHLPTASTSLHRSHSAIMGRAKPSVLQLRVRAGHMACPVSTWQGLSSACSVLGICTSHPPEFSNSEDTMQTAPRFSERLFSPGTAQNISRAVRVGSARAPASITSSPVRAPHSGYHFDGRSGRFFEGWYFKVTKHPFYKPACLCCICRAVWITIRPDLQVNLPERGVSFAFIYSVEDPKEKSQNTGIAAQVL